MNIKIIFSLLLLCLWIHDSLNAQDTLIHNKSLWTYLDDGAYLDNDWTEQNYPSAHWKEGYSPLGFDTQNKDGGKINTSIRYGDTTDRKHKNITSYFKKKIEIENPDDYIAYKINYNIDDGAVFYINNIEVDRFNMPKERIDAKTLATNLIKREDENKVHSTYIESKYFNPGVNTIAVSVHQVKRSSSDLIFNLNLLGFKDASTLHDYIKNEKDDLNNLNLILLDQKHELNEAKIKASFNNNIINIQWGIIGIGLLLFGILSYLFYKKYVQYTLEREKQFAEKSEVEKKFIDKKQEIINYLIGNIRNKAFLKEIKAELLHVSSMNKSVQKNLATLIHKVDVQSQHEEDWERMKIHFDAVHSGFFERLSQKHPVLSQQELKHCSFIKLHLDTKEISQILRIDPKSVQAARYRIKKKMKLTESENLRSVIISF